MTGQEAPENAREIESFVKDATLFFSQRKTHAAVLEFKNDIRWKKQHLELFVVDEKDVVWYLENEYYLTWLTFSKLKNINKEPLFKTMRSMGSKGGWSKFLWNQDLVYSYTLNVKKGKSSFIIGAIVFEESVPLQVQEQVFRARNYFINEGFNSTVEQINNPSGQFVYGSISLELYNHEGTCLADSYDNTNVGRESNEFRDDNGNLIFADYLKATENEPGYNWIEHKFGGLHRRSFVLRLHLSEIKNFYILVSNYYPQVNENFVIQHVKNAISYLKKKGVEKALADFSKPHGEFYKARLSIVVYDQNGIVKAHSKYPSVVGLNAMDRLDQGGYPITKNILSLMESQGKGWIFHYLANATEMVYGQKIETSQGPLIITAQGYTPISPRAIASGIAERISRTLLTSPTATVLHQLNFGGSLWSRGYIGVQESPAYGDIFIEVYTSDGFCASAGFNHDKMWKYIDPAFFKAAKKLKKSQKIGAWMYAKQRDMSRYFYIRYCQKSPIEKYYIFAGYTKYGKEKDI